MNRTLRRFDWSRCLFAASLLFGLSSVARAQVSLDLTTTAQQHCIVVTDAQGIRSNPGGGTGLIATGVTMSGTGCGTPVVAPTPNPLPVFSAPTSGAPGTTFLVGWSVANADSCVGTATRDGVAVSPLAGWTTTTSVAGPRSVTLSTAGNYVLSLACSNSAGTTSGSVSIPVQSSTNPPTPNPLVLTPSATTGTVGDTFSLNWTVAGATTCAGSVTLDGSPLTSLSGWTTTTSTSGPRSVTLNTAGTYAFSLRCENTAGFTSGSTSITVSTAGGGGDQCGQQQTGDVWYTTQLHTTIDITKFENILGKPTVIDPPVVFPGLNLSPKIKNLGKTAFVAAKFVVPANIATNKRGTISLGENEVFNKKMTISISPTCGFAQNPPDNNCLLSNLNQGQGLTWKISGAGVACTLTPGQTYFLNMKFSSPPDDASCSASTCPLPLNNSVYTQ